MRSRKSKSWRAPSRFTIEMSIQSSNEFAEREKESIECERFKK